MSQEYKIFADDTISVSASAEQFKTEAERVLQLQLQNSTSVITYIALLLGKKLSVKNKMEQFKDEYIRSETAFRIQQSAREAESLSIRLNEILVSSSELPGKLPEFLKSASWWLAKARREYADTAFDPYWTAVEKAAASLGEFYSIVKTLSSNAKEYYNKLSGRRHTFPVFPVRLESLPDPKPVIKEFHRVVRMGQTNFQFANIWEHRKTREVLIAGFRTLGDAVDNLTSVVGGGISALRDTLDSNLVQMVEEQIRSREIAEKSADEQAKTREAVERLKRM